MRKIFITLSVLLLLSGCTRATQYGPCIGLNDTADPKLRYRYSAWNIAMGILFFEMIVPPLVVVLDVLQCPIGSTEQ